MGRLRKAGITRRVQLRLSEADAAIFDKYDAGQLSRIMAIALHSISPDSRLGLSIPTLVRPAIPLTHTIVRLQIEGRIVRLVFPEKLEEFRAVVRRFEYEWMGWCWQKAIPPGVDLVDRASEIVNLLLLAGFCVQVQHTEIRNRAIAAQYIPLSDMYKRKCEYCNAWFSAKRPRRCCNRSCAARLTRQSLGQDWKSEEIALLERLAESTPMPEIVNRLRGLERRNGWTVRTSTAIQVKMKRLGLSRRCTLDNFSPSELARILNVARDRTESWLERHGLQSRKVLGNKRLIRRADFCKWGRSRQELLAGVDPDGLQWLTGWQDAQAIATAPRSTAGFPIAVRRVDTGEVFYSIRDAARKNYLSPASIRRALNSNVCRSSGSQWEILE